MKRKSAKPIDQYLLGTWLGEIMGNAAIDVAHSRLSQQDGVKVIAGATEVLNYLIRKRERAGA